MLVASVLVGGALNDGYSQSRDYVSALSGRGTTAAYVGVVGLLGYSVAHAASGLAFRRQSRVVLVALLLAAASGVVVAVSRINCPGGAARCSVDDQVPSDGLDAVHGLGVFAYEVFFLVGVVAAAAWFVRAGRSQRATGALLGALAAASVGLLVMTPDDHPGTVQRAWLLVNAAAIMVLAASAGRSTREDSTV